ncbi:uncharacterized protein LOC108099764 [Drosophila ficusphila]|uniref:uncharacterized protein LOC108099764 n=1 Tax=Drosophila ficusphila TaxID=30025 RepID=UPI0007E81F1D|nr:uncharacterized protein LOC108099764 [Drosophila ficusphila]
MTPICRAALFGTTAKNFAFFHALTFAAVFISERNSRSNIKINNNNNNCQKPKKMWRGSVLTESTWKIVEQVKYIFRNNMNYPVRQQQPQKAFRQSARKTVQRNLMESFLFATNTSMKTVRNIFFPKLWGSGAVETGVMFKVGVWVRVRSQNQTASRIMSGVGANCTEASRTQKPDSGRKGNLLRLMAPGYVFSGIGVFRLRFFGG